MPKSKLNSNIDVSVLDNLQANMGSVEIEDIVVGVKILKRPKFLSFNFYPPFRVVGGIETNKVDYDTYIRWMITRTPLPDIMINIPTDITSSTTVWNEPLSLADPYGIAFTFEYCCTDSGIPQIRFVFNDGKWVGASLFYTPDSPQYVLNGQFHFSVPGYTNFGWIATGYKVYSNTDVIRVAALFVFKPNTTELDVIGRAQKNGEDYPTQMMWQHFDGTSNNYDFTTLNSIEVDPDTGKISNLRILSPIIYENWEADPWLLTI